MRVFFVNRFYWPAEPATAQLLVDLAESLAGRGWQTMVVSGHSGAGLTSTETRNGVRIARVGRTMAATQNLARRLLDFASFRGAAVQLLRSEVRAGDLVVALTDPPLIGAAVAAVTKSRGAHLVHWAHDIYPEILHAVSPSLITQFATKVTTPRRDRAWRDAAACVTLGEQMAAVIRSAGVAQSRVHVLPNWAPQGLEPAPEEAVRSLREKWRLRDRFVVGYSGNLGRVHDLSGLVEVASRLRDDARIQFLFTGGGAGFTKLQAMAKAHGLENFHFLPSTPRHELAASLSVPDVQILSVREGCEQYVFPSKLYGIAAIGRPMLALANLDSEVARTVKENRMGAVFQSQDSEGIAQWLKKLAADRAELTAFGAAASEFHHRSGGWKVAVERWDSLLRMIGQSE